MLEHMISKALKERVKTSLVLERSDVEC
jgi:hypothetical protein